MDYGFLSCVPLIVLIVGALITKRITEMMVLASLVGAICVYRADFFDGYIDMLYAGLTNSSYQFILILLMGFGAMIQLMQKSGALNGFADKLSGIARGKRRTMLIIWCMSFFMFVDDYLNSLTTTFSMRGITDRNGIPREHLSFQVSLMSASLCVLVPFSSWAAFSIGLIKEQGLAFSDYLRGIPLMFFPLMSIVLCFLLAAGILPKIGPLKKAYERVKKGGSPVPKDTEGEIAEQGTERGESRSLLYSVVPIGVLVVTTILCDNDLVHGLLAAIAVQVVLYLGKKLMTLTEFVDCCFDGMKSMLSLAVIIFFAYVMNEANQTMRFSEFLIDQVSGIITPELFPLIVFITVAFCVFATSGYWVIQVITVPIFMPLAQSMDVYLPLVVGAVMSGVTFGSVCCFYSDVVFMTSAGSQVSNIRQVRTSAPYLLIMVAISAAGYIAAGLLM